MADPQQLTSSSDVRFFGIGAMKAASSWIAQCLIEHPAICFPNVDGREVKELHYFDTRLDRGAPELASFFTHCPPGAVCGEYTPRYLYDTRVPERLAHAAPHAKLIVCLRDPLARALSQYRFNRGIEGATFEEALERIPELIDRGRYHEQLTRYLARFPREQLLITWHEDISTDPVAFMQEIYRFLGIDPTFEPPSAVSSVNETQPLTFRSERLERARQTLRTRLRSLPGRASLIALGRRLGLHRLERSILAANLTEDREGQGVEISAAARHRVLSELYEDMRALEDLTRRDLSAWYSTYLQESSSSSSPAASGS
jgi:hypothetical protein